MSETPENFPGNYDRRPRPAPAPAVVGNGPTMPVITIWEPYASHIVFGSKRIENRDWKPWAKLMGRRIAIHAAMRPLDVYDISDAQVQARRAGSSVLTFPLSELDARRGHIIGTAILSGWFESGGGTAEPWEVGRFCWRLADVRPCVPVRAKGAQGIWQFDEQTVREADRQWHRDNSPRVAAN